MIDDTFLGGMTRGTEYDLKNQLLNRPEYKTYQKQMDVLGREVQSGMESLQKSYDQSIAQAYQSYLGSNAAARGSNIFTGYKDYMYKANKGAFDEAIANAYNTFAQNAGTLQKDYATTYNELAQAREKQLQSDIKFGEEYSNILTDSANIFSKMWDELDAQSKRQALEAAINSNSKYNDLSSTEKIKLLETEIANNPDYARYLELSGNYDLIMPNELTDELTGGVSTDGYRLYTPAELSKRLEDENFRQRYYNFAANTNVGGYNLYDYIKKYNRDLYDDIIANSDKYKSIWKTDEYLRSKTNYERPINTEDVKSYGYEESAKRAGAAEDKVEQGKLIDAMDKAYEYYIEGNINVDDERGWTKHGMDVIVKELRDITWDDITELYDIDLSIDEAIRLGAALDIEEFKDRLGTKKYKEIKSLLDGMQLAADKPGIDKNKYTAGKNYVEAAIGEMHRRIDRLSSGKHVYGYESAMDKIIKRYIEKNRDKYKQEFINK